MNNPILKSKMGEEDIQLCGYSFAGFHPDNQELQKKRDYVYKNCKYWHFFGDGLCFSCDCPEQNCPFVNIKL